MSFSACGRKGEGPDIEAESFRTDKITIYSDGYFGRTLDEPIEITDPVDIERILHEASKVGEYFYAEDTTEGLNGIWIDFNNGTVISMRYDENYGNIGETFMTYGTQSSKDLILPEGLNEIISEIICENEG